VTEFDVPGGDPSYIAAGSDGNLWFTEPHSDKIGRITPAGSIVEFNLPAFSTPTAITAGPDGNLWFAEIGSNKIGRITPGGAIVEYPSDRPWFIAAGPDGNVWFTQFTFGDRFSGNKLGVVTPSGVITEKPIPTNGQTYMDNVGPHGITTGTADGNVWFTERSLGRIARMTLGGSVTRFPLAMSNVAPGGITSGPDGNLWFTTIFTIGRITPTGTITEFATTANAFPTEITRGPDGNLWFSQQGAIGRITPAGAITDFQVASTPEGITAGPDGNIWFTLPIPRKIGRFLVR
jgi:streptogramin lyase